MLQDKEPTSNTLIPAITFQTELSEYQQRCLNNILSIAYTRGCNRINLFAFQSERPSRPVLMFCFHGIEPDSDSSQYLQVGIIATNANNPSRTFYDAQIHQLPDPSMRECIAQIKTLYKQPQLDCNLIWQTDFENKI